ncbi:MAG TPA: hypothetical protein VJV74_12310 [Terriglobia bacterium]|nr:hypothetical protein [Terriglobia bacterium]
MAKHRLNSKSMISQTEFLPRSEAGPRGGEDEPIVTLHHVEGAPMDSLEPGDVLLLPSDRLSKTQLDATFHAVLACPSCGTLTPISPAQYFGIVPVICCSDRCACHFRIEGEGSLRYLPVA